jgi:hypothetical protein
MSKFLIEVPHGAEKYECMRSIAIFLNSGSHFLSNADWGCSDGEHKAWFIMEAENKEEALQIVPPVYRINAKITKLIKYNLADMGASLNHHTA